MNNEKESQEALDKKLNKLIDPLYPIIFNYFSAFSQSGISKEKLEEDVKDVLALAILEGVKLAELVEDRLDKALIKQVQEETQKTSIITDLMCPDKKARDASIALNMNDKSGRFNRFVPASDIVTGKVKPE